MNRDTPLWYGDSPNIGTLCKRIRNHRNLEPGDVAEISGLSRATISRLEGNKTTTTRKSFEKYTRALRQGAPPLTLKQVDRLNEMYAYSQPDKILELEEELAVIDPNDIRSGACPTELQELMNLFRRQRYPAFIRDNLWFVHAYNGAIMHLFGVDFSNSANLSSWIGWHVIGTKFYVDSPIRKAHMGHDYFRHAVACFWKDVQRYLFTWQVRILVKEIYELSWQHKLKFEELWSLATTFWLEEDMVKYFVRQLRDPRSSTNEDGIKIQAHANEPVYTEVEVVPNTGYTVNYTLVVWHPDTPEAKSLFNHIARLRDSRDILFSAEYDIHVNNWPQVKERIDI